MPSKKKPNKIQFTENVSGFFAAKMKKMSPLSEPRLVKAIILVRPYRSDRAPSLGLVKADSNPAMRLPYRVNCATRDWTCGMRHWGFSPEKTTGVMVKPGTVDSCSWRYSRHIRLSIRLILGVMTPPKDTAMMKKGNSIQYIYASPSVPQRVLSDQ